MFDQAKQVGIRPHDVARALDLNRVTVSLWFNGHSSPHKLLTDKVAKLLDAIGRGVDAGELPVSHDLKRKERSDSINAILQRHMDEIENSDNQGVSGLL